MIISSSGKESINDNDILNRYFIDLQKTISKNNLLYRLNPRPREKPLKNCNFPFKIISCYNALSEVTTRRATWLLHMNIRFLPASILS